MTEPTIFELILFPVVIFGLIGGFALLHLAVDKFFDKRNHKNT